MNANQKLFNDLLYTLNLPLLPIGKSTVTAGMLLYVAILLWLLVGLTGTLQKKAIKPLLLKSRLNADAQNIAGMLVRYTTIAIGAIIILNTAGVDMTVVTVIAGTLGLGLSLGLQGVAKNFIGGLVILWERPIRLGDHIQIADVKGVVTRIALRATTIHNEDGIDVIVPNADFMSSRVINWDYSNDGIKISLPVTTSIKSNPQRVQALLLEIISNEEGILKEPAPEVFLESFGENTLNFTVRAAVSNATTSSNKLRSHFNLNVYKRFQEEHIQLSGECQNA